MPELTAAQKRKMAQLEKRADAVAEGTDIAEETEAVPLCIMLGEGNTVEIGGHTYEIAAFPLGKLSQAGKLLAACPELIVSTALSATPQGEVSVQKATEMLNDLSAKANAETAPIPEDLIAFSLSTAAMQVSEEEAEAMTALTVLAAQRRHPNITTEDIADNLDLPTFLIVLCRIFAENKPLKARF